VKRNRKSAPTGSKSARSHKNQAQPEQEGRSKIAAPPLRVNPTTPINQRPDESSMLRERKRLYLGVGDEVTHVRYEEWGIGVVMECMTSSVPGGTCLVRIRFQDGQLRCFNNDLDNDTCCYYFGMRRYWNPTHGVNAIRSKFFLRG
jgi:hypothetical protein